MWGDLRGLILGKYERIILLSGFIYVQLFLVYEAKENGAISLSHQLCKSQSGRVVRQKKITFF